MSIASIIAAQKPNGTAWYTWPNLFVGGEGPLQMEVRFAGKGNPAYRSADLKLLNEGRNRAPTIKVTESKLEEGARREAELFASTVIVGWRECFENGKPAPATPEKFLETLLAIAESFETQFMTFLAWCREPSNFPNALETSGVELGKG